MVVVLFSYSACLSITDDEHGLDSLTRIFMNGLNSTYVSSAHSIAMRNIISASMLIRFDNEIGEESFCSWAHLQCNQIL